MAALVRKYTIPLRRETQKTPNYKRGPKAVRALRQFLQKHMKTTDVKIGPKLNNKLWSQGIRNPPCRVTVEATKDGDICMVELEGHVYPQKKVKKEKKGGLRGKLEGLTGSKSKAEEVAEEPSKPTETPASEVKKQERAEAKKE